MQVRLALVATCLLLAGCSPGARQATESETSATALNGISLDRFDDRVKIALDGQPFTNFYFQPKWDKPFLYPIRTVSGTVISRGFPVQPRPGDTHDHPWHRGIWYGHGDINGEDFWREQKDKGTARLTLSEAPKLSGSTLDVNLAMMTAKNARIGNIGERYSFSRDGNNFLIDSTITIMADAGKPLRFGDSDDGGFGFRLSDDFREDRGAEMVNSEGLKGSEQMWGKPARWVKYSATVDGKRVGLVMLDHPSNLRYPTRWHARGYALCAANPFALRSFTKDKAADGSYTLPLGKTLRFRYLVIVHEGDMSRESIEQYFANFQNAS
jgi:hypothetical protein